MAFDFFRLKKSNGQSQNGAVIVVSGLPRSGTSMMMKMLEAGGTPIIKDDLRRPDENNPKGYYEFERVKKLKDGDSGWLENASGKAVKVISALLENLPPNHHYKVIFMQRKMDEVLESQTAMLERMGETTGRVSDEKLVELYEKHLESVKLWLTQQPNIDVLYVGYNELISYPDPQLERVDQFLNRKLDMPQMKNIIDHQLYRQRSTGQKS